MSPADTANVRNAAATIPQPAPARSLTGEPGPRALPEELPRERLPHHGRELEALGVHTLVVAVEHDRVLGVRDAQRVQPEAVGRDALPAEELGVGAASGD